MSEIGVILRNKNSNHLMELWFEDEHEMNLHLKIYDNKIYEVKKYLTNQQMMIFDDDIE